MAVFGDLHGAAHGDAGVAVAHGAFQGGAGGEVELAGAGGGGDGGDVGGVDAAAGHDEGVAGVFGQLAQEGDAGFGGGFLSGGEDAVAAEVFDGLQGGEGVAAHVEGAVEGDGHALRRLHQQAHGFPVHVPVGGQAAEDDAVRPEAARQFDVAQHRFALEVVVEEVPAAGADDDVQPARGEVARHGDGAVSKA